MGVASVWGELKEREQAREDVGDVNGVMLRGVDALGVRGTGEEGQLGGWYGIIAAPGWGSDSGTGFLPSSCLQHLI